MNFWANMVVAFSMYSKIPMPHLTWTKDNMRYALCFFPCVGIVIGLLEIIWFHLAKGAGFHTLLTAAVFVLIPVLVSGGIHLDGLLDTADALSSWQTQERRLEILKDSHAGAFAIIVCCSYFLAQFAIWTEAGRRAVLVLAIGFVLSRALNGYGITSIPCARNSGLAHTFASAADQGKCRKILLIEAVICMILMVLTSPVRGIVGVILALITFAACRKMALSKFGGTTGDIQGFFLQVCELAMAFGVIITGHLLG